MTKGHGPRTTNKTTKPTDKRSESKHHSAPDYGDQDVDLLDLIRRDAKEIIGEHNDIGQLARGDSPLFFLIESRVGAALSVGV